MKRTVKNTFLIRRYSLIILYLSIIFTALCLFNGSFFILSSLLFGIFIFLSKVYWKCPKCNVDFPIFKLNKKEYYKCPRCKRTLIKPPVDLSDYKKNHIH